MALHSRFSLQCSRESHRLSYTSWAGNNRTYPTWGGGNRLELALPNCFFGSSIRKYCHGFCIYNHSKQMRIDIRVKALLGNTKNAPVVSEGGSGSIREQSVENGQANLIRKRVPLFESSVVPQPYLWLQNFSKLSAVDQVLVVFSFVSVMMIGTLFAVLVTAIPTLKAVHKAAISVRKLADVAREELPGTMAAIRLSTMEISDLTLELNDLSQEIHEGVRSSARAVHAAEAGIRNVGALAKSQTMEILQERASIPVAAVKPVVVNAAESTRQAVAQAHKVMIDLATQSGVPGLILRFTTKDQNTSSGASIEQDGAKSKPRK